MKTKTNSLSILLPVLMGCLFHTATAQEKTPVEKAPAPPIYVKASDTKALMSKDGQKIVVHGTTSGTGKSRSGTNFVNFDGAEFYLITFKTDLIAFKQGEPADIYDDKRLAVTGVVSVFKEKPQFKLTDPAQVQILEADAVFPPQTEKPAAAKKKPIAEKKKPADPEAKPVPAEPKPKPPVDPKKYFK